MFVGTSFIIRIRVSYFLIILRVFLRIIIIMLLSIYRRYVITMTRYKIMVIITREVFCFISISVAGQVCLPQWWMCGSIECGNDILRFSPYNSIIAGTKKKKCEFFLVRFDFHRNLHSFARSKNISARIGSSIVVNKSNT